MKIFLIFSAGILVGMVLRYVLEVRYRVLCFRVLQSFLEDIDYGNLYYRPFYYGELEDFIAAHAPWGRATLINDILKLPEVIKLDDSSYFYAVGGPERHES